MPCKAEEQALAEMRLRRLQASHHMQLEKAAAELDIARSNKSIYDWSMVRLAEAITRCWDSRCVQAEDALERCKKRHRSENAAARLS